MEHAGRPRRHHSSRETSSRLEDKGREEGAAIVPIFPIISGLLRDGGRRRRARTAEPTARVLPTSDPFPNPFIDGLIYPRYHSGHYSRHITLSYLPDETVRTRPDSRRSRAVLLPRIPSRQLVVVPELIRRGLVASADPSRLIPDTAKTVSIEAVLRLFTSC